MPENEFDIERMRRLSDTIEAEAAAEDRSVVVISKSGSRVQDVRYSARAFRLGSEELSELTLKLVKEASDKAGRELSEALMSMRQNGPSR
ncbi:hypothetical protein [Salininema proteolyticum]|uniref:YbaB/EbfC DNA-binding family protein n=1 Tax=Salininema proteolyticum TaxID=1607685 RepID=A0ABV8TYX0_9ACTN